MLPSHLLFGMLPDPQVATNIFICFSFQIQFTALLKQFLVGIFWDIIQNANLYNFNKINHCIYLQ